MPGLLRDHGWPLKHIIDNWIKYVYVYIYIYIYTDSERERERERERE